MNPLDSRKSTPDGASPSSGPSAGRNPTAAASGAAVGQPQAQPTSGPGRAGALPAPVRRKRRILFVDTDAARLQLLERMLAGQRRDWDIVFTRACSSATELVGMAPLDA